jgi:hypothetical protein
MLFYFIVNIFNRFFERKIADVINIFNRESNNFMFVSSWLIFMIFHEVLQNQSIITKKDFFLHSRLDLVNSIFLLLARIEFLYLLK